LKINLICYFNPLSGYFVSASLSPNPSPEVGGALIQKNCVYFYLPPLTSGEGNEGERPVNQNKPNLKVDGNAMGLG
jgi:hypothetical protein